VRGRQLVGEIRAEKRQREVGEVDDAQETPGDAEPQPEQRVEAAREEPGQQRLADQVQAWQCGALPSLPGLVTTG
jgi:hypothetical protein